VVSLATTNPASASSTYAPGGRFTGSQVVVTHKPSDTEVQNPNALAASGPFAEDTSRPAHAISVKAAPKQYNREELGRNPANVSTG
jgi:hypothetical protein